jgi:hypothetical protein
MIITTAFIITIINILYSSFVPSGLFFNSIFITIASVMIISNEKIKPMWTIILCYLVYCLSDLGIKTFRIGTKDQIGTAILNYSGYPALFVVWIVLIVLIIFFRKPKNIWFNIPLFLFYPTLVILHCILLYNF